MNIETRIFKLLNEDRDLLSLLKSMREGSISESGIWKHVIPENYRKTNYAPFIRISPVYEGDGNYFDDAANSEEQRAQISFWCKNDAQAYQIKNRIDDILKESNFTRYTVNENPRYIDSDIDLLINHRKYRFVNWKNES
ncbi:hypothetical protein ACH0AK_14650 [Enterococcus pernyi]